MTGFRHEVKHEISYMDMIILRSRLPAVLMPDENALKNSRYRVQSLYFDTPEDKALMEKINGIDHRSKFRFRYYNDDPSYIKLEKKSKIHGLTSKETAGFSTEEVEQIIEGDFDFLLKRPDNISHELYYEMRTHGMRPRTIVEYDREAYVYPAGNVRVTMDYNISSGMQVEDYMKDNRRLILLPDKPIILEVKWDEFLPDIVRKAVSLTDTREGAFSKYAGCRALG